MQMILAPKTHAGTEVSRQEAESLAQVKSRTDAADHTHDPASSVVIHSHHDRSVTRMTRPSHCLEHLLTLLLLSGPRHSTCVNQACAAWSVNPARSLQMMSGNCNLCARYIRETTKDHVKGKVDSRESGNDVYTKSRPNCLCLRQQRTMGRGMRSSAALEGDT